MRLLGFWWIEGGGDNAENVKELFEIMEIATDGLIVRAEKFNAIMMQWQNLQSRL